MSAPPIPYSRQASFTQFATEKFPTTGQGLEAEFNKISQSIGTTQSRLAEIQRDDGQLANLSVHPDSLSHAVRSLLAAESGVPRGNWAPGVIYQPKDVVEHNGASYLAATEHTAGADFDADFAAGKWLLLSFANDGGTLRADLLAGNGAALVGFQQAGAGAVPRTMQDKGREWVSPLDRGAIGDGVADDSAALASAGSFMFLPVGKTFRVSTNCTIGTVLSAGGVISVDAGVTLTVGSVIGDETTVVFAGAGTVKITSQFWSLGWFAGSSGNEKWDFLRRGLSWNVPYRCVFPAPKANDPAATQSSSGEWWWKLTGPMYWDDPENEGVIYVNGGFRATKTMTSGFCFSPTNKTENVLFIGLLRIDGQGMCDYPFHVKGGARLKIVGELRPMGGVDNLRVDTSNWPVDEFEVDFLHSTGFTRRAAAFIGSDGSRALINCRIDHILTNGAKVGANTTDFFQFEGVVRNFKVGVLTSNIDVTLEGPTQAIVHFTNNAASAPAYGVVIDTLNNRVGEHTAVRSSDSTGGTGNKSEFTIGELYTNATTAQHVNLDWSKEVKIGKIEPIGAKVTVSSTCSDTFLPPIDLWRLSDSGVRTRIGGVLTKSMTAGTGALADDSAAVFNLLDSDTRRTGLLSVATSADNNTGVFHVRVGISPLIRALVVGANVNTTTGVLTGTTGEDGKLTVSVSGDSVYIENRTGGQIDLHATFT